jgi:hypothetical protein
MKRLILAIILMTFLLPACVKKDAKCKREHKAARKKGTRGWQY